MTMQFILMLNNTLLIIVKVFIRQKRELKLLEVQERLRSRKVLVLQELEVLRTHYLEEVVEYLDQDQDLTIKK